MSRLVFSPLARETVFGPKRGREAAEGSVAAYWQELLASSAGKWNDDATRKSLIDMIKYKFHNNPKLSVLREEDVKWDQLVKYVDEGKGSIPECHPIKKGKMDAINTNDRTLLNKVRETVQNSIKTISWRLEHKPSDDTIINAMLLARNNYIDKRQVFTREQLVEVISDIHTLFPHANEKAQMFKDNVIDMKKFEEQLNKIVDKDRPSMKESGKSVTRDEERDRNRKRAEEKKTRRDNGEDFNYCFYAFRNMDPRHRTDFEHSILDDTDDDTIKGMDLEEEYDDFYEFVKHVKEILNDDLFNKFKESVQRMEGRIEAQRKQNESAGGKQAPRSANAMLDPTLGQVLVTSDNALEEYDDEDGDTDRVRGPSFQESEDDTDNLYPKCTAKYAELSNEEKTIFLLRLASGYKGAKSALRMIIRYNRFGDFRDFMSHSVPQLNDGERNNLIKNIEKEEADLARRDGAGPSSAAQHIVTGMRLLQL